ncbi:MAG: Holliday junction resolvase RuvX [Caldilineaceae bacterium]
MSEWVNAGKLLALDVGLARIGVAVCDPLRLTVRPVTVLQRASRRADFQYLAQLVRNEEVVAVVCGLPLNMDGSESNQSQTVRKWALRLAQALRTLLGYSLPVIFWDERLTTFAAQAIMAEQGSKFGEDAIAAAVILQSYLDAQRRGEALDFGRIDLPPRERVGQ